MYLLYNLSGKRCHYGQYCSPNPCQNGGLCEEGSSGPICQCRGFTGLISTIQWVPVKPLHWQIGPEEPSSQRPPFWQGFGLQYWP